MTAPKLSKFIVFYQIPASVMADWSKTDEKARKAAEEKMKAEWFQWIQKNAKAVKLTEAAGKTKRVTASGVSDTRNDICLYSIVEAESPEAAAKLFEKHPHLQIPQSSIDVMSVRAMNDGS